MEWLRWRLRRPARDAQEERDATAFLAAMQDADAPVYRIRARDLPSVNRRIRTVLLADEDGRAPWPSAPYAPDPEDQEEPQEEPQERAQEHLPPLRAWNPGDPGRAPTGVIAKITPEVERQLLPYLRSLPDYPAEPGQ